MTRATTKQDLLYYLGDERVPVIALKGLRDREDASLGGSQSRVRADQW